MPDDLCKLWCANCRRHIKCQVGDRRLGGGGAQLKPNTPPFTLTWRPPPPPPTTTTARPTPSRMAACVAGHGRRRHRCRQRRRVDVFSASASLAAIVATMPKKVPAAATVVPDVGQERRRPRYRGHSQRLYSLAHRRAVEGEEGGGAVQQSARGGQGGKWGALEATRGADGPGNGGSRRQSTPGQPLAGTSRPPLPTSRLPMQLPTIVYLRR